MWVSKCGVGFHSTFGNPHCANVGCQCGFRTHIQCVGCQMWSGFPLHIFKPTLATHIGTIFFCGHPDSPLVGPGNITGCPSGPTCPLVENLSPLVLSMDHQQGPGLVGSSLPRPPPQTRWLQGGGFGTGFTDSYPFYQVLIPASHSSRPPCVDLLNCRTA